MRRPGEKATSPLSVHLLSLLFDICAREPAVQVISHRPAVPGDSLVVIRIVRVGAKDLLLHPIHERFIKLPQRKANVITNGLAEALRCVPKEQNAQFQVYLPQPEF